jgi:hypothetical protein
MVMYNRLGKQVCSMVSQCYNVQVLLVQPGLGCRQCRLLSTCVWVALILAEAGLIMQGMPCN